MKKQRLFLMFLTFLRCIFSISGVMELFIEENLFTSSDIMVDFFTSCKNKYKTVVTNNADKKLIKHLSSLNHGALVILHDSSAKTHNYSWKNKIADLFITILKTSVNGELKRILSNSRNSPWWDVMKPYFILSDIENGCKDAKSALEIIWDKNILDGYFICFDSQRKPFIFTFNPYSNRASLQWKMIDETSNKTYYMAYYNRPYDKDNICKGFNFDRTKHVDKNKVKIVSPIANVAIPHYAMTFHQTVKNVFKTSLKFAYSDCHAHRTQFSYRKSADIVLCEKSNSEFDTSDIPTSYPTIIDGLYIFSNNQKYVSPLEKIYSSFNISMILGMLIISIMTYLVILHTNSHRGYSFATFEILRLWTGNSLTIRLKSQSLRIFFSSIVIYFLIMQLTRQGDLVDFLSKTELRKNANFITDLRSDYYKKIFTTVNNLSILENEDTLKSKTVYTSDDKICVEAVLEDKSSACLVYYYSFLDQLLMKKLLNNDTLRSFHLSKYPISSRARGYFTRIDWPLKKKFDNYLMWLDSSGINDKMMSGELHIESDLQTSQYVSNFESISLDALSFIFYFWVIGMILSIVCFFFENIKVLKKNILNCKTNKKIVLCGNNKLRIFIKNNKQKIMNKGNQKTNNKINKFLLLKKNKKSLNV